MEKFNKNDSVVYRINGRWFAVETQNSEFKNKCLVSLDNPGVTEELIYLLDDDEKIDMSLLIKREKYYIPDIDKIKKILANYQEKFNFPEKEAKAIIERYSSLILIPTITDEFVEELIKWETPKSHCPVEAD